MKQAVFSETHALTLSSVCGQSYQAKSNTEQCPSCNIRTKIKNKYI